MGNTKSIPVVGEIVTIIETATKFTAACTVAVAGVIVEPAFNNEKNPCFESSKQLLGGAENALTEYAEKNIIAGSINRQIQLHRNKKEEAERIGDKMLDSANGLLNNTPIIGHVKGAIHYITGDAEQGNACMIGASRGVAVLAAGALTGGIGGGVVAAGLAGVGTGLVYDSTATLIDSNVHNEERLHGTMATINQLNKTGDLNALVDLSFTLGCDFMTASAAQRVVKARQLKNQKLNQKLNQKEGSCQAPALTEEVVAESIADETNSVTQGETVHMERNDNTCVIHNNISVYAS